MKDEIDNKRRCFGSNSKLYAKYHDTEWGIPVRNDQVLFECLILEGAQAGLSWETVLKKREGYRAAFANFDIKKCAQLSDEYLESQRENPDIIRNKLKIYSVRKNAVVAIALQKEFGSLEKYFWSFVNNQPIMNNWESVDQVPAQTPQSLALSKDLKKRGMNFVGPTIIYAFMQAVGMVWDHWGDCWVRRHEIS